MKVDNVLEVILVGMIGCVIFFLVWTIGDVVHDNMSYTDSRGTVCANKDVAPQCDQQELKDVNSDLLACSGQCGKLVYDMNASTRKEVYRTCLVKTCKCRWGCP